MSAVNLREKPDRRRVTRHPRFDLQRTTDTDRGERYVILIDGPGEYAEPSKTLSEADSRDVLRKMGHSAEVIESMVSRARAEGRR